MKNYLTSSNPIAGFNINTGTSKSFKNMIEEFTSWAKQEGEPPPLQVKDGWIEFTPAMSLAFVWRSVLDRANREPSFNQVVYYGNQMLSKDWQKTGQAMILDTNGIPLDGQHRAWASVLTKSAFPTYIVSSVPPIDDLFAFMDNGKVRSAADALSTAGLNGASRLTASIVRIGKRYDRDVITMQSKGKIAKATPMETLRFVKEHPEVRDAAVLITSDYEETASLMLYNDVAGFVTWKILSGYDKDTLDDFMHGLQGTSSNGKNEKGDPLVALRKKLESYAEINANVGRVISGRKTKKIAAHIVLAHIIRAFNAWQDHEVLKKVEVPSDATFPRFACDETEEEAAA